MQAVRTSWYVLAALAPVLLAGCTSVPVPPAPPIVAPSLFADARFAPPLEEIGAEGLFALSAPMKAYLASPQFLAQQERKGFEQGLVDALYEIGQLKLVYDASKTRNAAHTFESRSGNCLSLVIMTAAFAKHFGSTVTFQSVQTDPSWSREPGLTVASHHVNLSFAKHHAGTPDLSKQMLTVDFLPSTDVSAFRTKPLPEQRIIAMYLNNRAAEALALNQVDLAYWWARKAIGQDENFVAAYNTLGVVYQRHRDFHMSERVFRAALAREPDNTMLMSNLMGLLVTLGRRVEAQALAQRLAVLDPLPPFHYFDRGLAAMKRKDFREAKLLFEKEVARAPTYHGFHFWLAQANLELGQHASAREQLALALETSDTPGERARYAAKLEHLRAARQQAKKAR
jgi:Tfp pilus assembly protein PilF